MKVKKIPQRTCLGCKSVKAKKELLRIVRTPDGEVVADPTGKKPGRGTYTCPQLACLEMAFKGAALDQALDIKLTDATRNSLRDALLKSLK